MAGTSYSGGVEFIAGAAITKGQLVRLSSGQVIPCTLATHVPIGVALNSKESGGKIAVQCSGEVDVLANGTSAIAIGDELSPGAGGAAIKYASGTGNVKAMRALAATSKASAYIRAVFYLPPTAQAA